MNRREVLTLPILLALSGCGGGTTSVATNREKIIIDNDIWDSDNLIVSIIGTYANVFLNKDVTVIMSEVGDEYSNIALYLPIYEYQPNSVKFAISHSSTDRGLPQLPANKVIDWDYRNEEFRDAFYLLREELLQAKPNSVKYITGGSLIFLNKFLKQKDNLSLFIDKVKELYLATGEFNYSSTGIRVASTKSVFNMLKGKIPFIIGKYNSNQKGLEFISNENIRKFYSVDTYKRGIEKMTYGDLDALLPALGYGSKIDCKVEFIGRDIVATSGSGDYVVNLGNIKDIIKQMILELENR